MLALGSCIERPPHDLLRELDRRSRRSGPAAPGWCDGVRPRSAPGPCSTIALGVLLGLGDHVLANLLGLLPGVLDHAVGLGATSRPAAPCSSLSIFWASFLVFSASSRSSLLDRLARARSSRCEALSAELPEEERHDDEGQRRRRSARRLGQDEVEPSGPAPAAVGSSCRFRASSRSSRLDDEREDETDQRERLDQREADEHRGTGLSPPSQVDEPWPGSRSRRCCRSRCRPRRRPGRRPDPCRSR